MASAARPSIVTLSADFGSVYGAQVKAVLYRWLPPGYVVELDLELPAHDIPVSSFLLRHMADRFPAGSVHYAVVDPGVGSARAPLAIRCTDGSVLVGPDNGLLPPLARALGGLCFAVRLDPTRVAENPRSVSPTFEGRDLFAPAAARIATGTPPESLGGMHPEPVVLPASEPELAPDRLAGRVAYVDRFGNVVTDLPGAWVPAGGTVRVRLGPSRMVYRLRRVRTYADLAPGEIGVLVSSFDLVELGARERSAARVLRAAPGAPVVLRFVVPDAKPRLRVRRRK